MWGDIWDLSNIGMRETIMELIFYLLSGNLTKFTSLKKKIPLGLGLNSNEQIYKKNLTSSKHYNIT